MHTQVKHSLTNLQDLIPNYNLADIIIGNKFKGGIKSCGFVREYVLFVYAWM